MRDRFPEGLLWFGGGFLLLLPAGLWLFSTFNRLIRLMSEKHRDEWLAFGRPRGFVNRSAGYANVESGYATLRASLIWIFRTPAWISGDAEARRLHQRWRLLVLVWNVGCVGLFAFLFVRFGFPIPPSHPR